MVKNKERRGNTSGLIKTVVIVPGVSFQDHAVSRLHTNTYKGRCTHTKHLIHSFSSHQCVCELAALSVRQTINVLLHSRQPHMQWLEANSHGRLG